MNSFNLITSTDSYKFSHFLQFPKDSESMFSYIESRGGKYKETVMFGLRYIIQNFISKPITRENINKAEKLAKFQGLPFNKEGWEYILENHNGYIPVKIKAIPEGFPVNTGNVLATIESTDPKVFWVVGHIEPMLLRIWYPITVATLAREIKKAIKPFVDKTSDNPESIDFKLVDFGARAATSHESASIAGMAHLISFSGTDTIEGIEAVMDTYNTEDFIAGSVPASEHSTITSWGRECEKDACENMVDTFSNEKSPYFTPLYACVSDAYNIFNTVDTIWGKQLKEKIINSSSLLIVRPDCYSDDTEILTKNGWKYFKDVKYSDEVASIDEQQNISFVIPNKIMNYDYEGDMYNFKGGYNRIDVMVTPNHRMVSFNDIKKKPIMEFDFAENIKLNHRKFLTSGKTFNGDGITPYERLLIAFQADGSYLSKKDKITGEVKNKNSKGLKLVDHETIRFNFTKTRKIERLVEIIKECGFTYSINQEESRPDQKTIYINVPINMKLYKTFDKWVNPTHRSYQWLSSFLDELSHWDSTIRNDNRFAYTTTIQENIETVLTACTLASKTYSYRIDKDNRSDIFSDVHVVSITNTNKIGHSGITLEKIKYKGKVYCVNVDSGIILVRRNKKSIICGNSGIPLEMVMYCLKSLDNSFGHTINSKGYKVLNNVRVIQGDGVDIEAIIEILTEMEKQGYSTDNITFGMGGALHQKDINRDTQKFALKCSAIKRNGEWQNVYKDPISDKGKISKKGLLDVVFDDVENKYITLTEGKTPEEVNKQSELVLYYENGTTFFTDYDSFQNVKNRASV